MLHYYVYTHKRPDTGQVFYVGIGRTPNPKVYSRAYTRARRSSEWLSTVDSCEGKFIVDIVAIFDDHLSCCTEEMRLINSYGRKSLNIGYLVNKAPGGHKWKDSIVVYQYALDGKFIAEWKDPKTAESVLGISHTSIYKSCRLFFKAGNYQFRTYKKEKIETYTDNKKKEIHQYSKLGSFIRSYTSISEAAEHIKVKPERLSQTAKKNKSCKGYLWSFSNEYCLVKRIIFQYTTSGELVAQYASLPEAAKALKVNSVNAIDCAIKGKIQKQAYDFLWTSQTNVKVFNNAAKTKNL